MNKLKIILFITWIWAWTALQLTKIFELVFRLLMIFPSQLLALIPTVAPKHTNGNTINIIRAHNEYGDITNKFRLFLTWYWEHGSDDKAFDTNGFEFRKFAKLLNCSLLYCSYLITDKTSHTSPDTFWNDVKRFLVYMNNNDGRYYQSNMEKDNVVCLPMGYVNFTDPKDIITDTRSVRDMITKFEKPIKKRI